MLNLIMPQFILNIFTALDTTTRCITKSADLCESYLDASISESQAKLKASIIAPETI